MFRSAMNCRLVATTLLFTFFCTTSVLAVETVLGGEFDGSESKTSGLPGSCENNKGTGIQLPYQTIGPIQVSSSGTYTLFDAFNFFIGRVITALVYQGAFNPASPQSNLVTPDGIDYGGQVQLTSGVNYTLVVQRWCRPGEGAWVVAFSGPGSVNSAKVIAVPAFTKGTITGGESNLNLVCGGGQYIQSGPTQVSRSGLYYYSDISIAYALDMCLSIYTAPVDTDSPNANRVTSLDDAGSVQLESGKDYYFVVQAVDSLDTGAYFFVLAPPSQFRLNPAMAGSWYDPATGGQGFFLDVFDDLDQIFLAWFTYDLERPDDSVAAQIGDPGHRWLTAFGDFQGTSAELSIEWTVGGIFDSVNPAPGQSEDGTISLHFDDCETGTVTYDLGTANASGVVPIKRIANDNVAACELSYLGPDLPGPL